VYSRAELLSPSTRWQLARSRTCARCKPGNDRTGASEVRLLEDEPRASSSMQPEPVIVQAVQLAPPDTLPAVAEVVPGEARLEPPRMDARSSPDFSTYSKGAGLPDGEIATVVIWSTWIRGAGDAGDRRPQHRRLPQPMQPRSPTRARRAGYRARRRRTQLDAGQSSR
jgi:hypothetical protein